MSRKFLFFALAALSVLTASHAVQANDAKVKVIDFADFNGKNGNVPEANVILASDGNYYGTTAFGGKHGAGTIYRMTPSGKIERLYSFSGDADGKSPSVQLIQASDGGLYGTTYAGGVHSVGTIFRVSTRGEFATLHAFDGVSGANPNSPLVEAGDGSLYGTTSSGGGRDVGIVFGITGAGSFKVVAAMHSAGSYPKGNILLADDGTIYGTTSLGGANEFGTLYSVSPGGLITVLYDFPAPGGQSGLVFSTAHDKIYGTSGQTIYQYDFASMTTVAEFPQGSRPEQLALGADGSTLYGFTSSDNGGVGFAFSCSPDGTLTTIATLMGLTPNSEAPTFTPEGAILGITPGTLQHLDGQVFKITGF